jgi:hypothetical protein
MMAGMEDPEEKPRTRMRWPCYVVLSMLVPVVYALRIGPVAWLATRGYIAASTMNTFYAPLAWVFAAIPDSQRWFSWYIELWV